MGKVISICSQKGGVGKTTTTVTIASILASEKNKRVLVIDADSQKNLSNWLSLDSGGKKGLYELLLDDTTSIIDVIQKTKLPNIYAVPASPRLVKVTSESFETSYPQKILAKKLDLIKDDFDYIIIDCAPAMSLLTTMALVASDGVLIPTELSKNCITGVRAVLSLIKEVDENSDKKTKNLGVLICRYQKPKSREVMVFLDSLETEMEEILIEHKIPSSTALLSAENNHTTIFKSDPKHLASQAYLAVSKHIKEALHARH